MRIFFLLRDQINTHSSSSTFTALHSTCLRIQPELKFNVFTGRWLNYDWHSRLFNVDEWRLKIQSLLPDRLFSFHVCWCRSSCATPHLKGSIHSLVVDNNIAGRSIFWFPFNGSGKRDTEHNPHLLHFTIIISHHQRGFVLEWKR